MQPRPHRRAPNQREAIKKAQEIEAPTAFQQRIAVDHVCATGEPGRKGEAVALVCIGVYSGACYAYPACDTYSATVEPALRHFCGPEVPVESGSRAGHPEGH